MPVSNERLREIYKQFLATIRSNGGKLYDQHTGDYVVCDYVVTLMDNYGALHLCPLFNGHEHCLNAIVGTPDEPYIDKAMVGGNINLATQTAGEAVRRYADGGEIQSARPAQ